ncbi:MAG: hypothetical protein CVV44_03815 [Spirochaetae bacterium HGW-Spirochaetae-1]|jgi:hypothetical protein|nr:MAG: hypothetical protein CVV44_03815 [Spirochaetae bacterium HGW-Spirochaetae-1]
MAVVKADIKEALQALYTSAQSGMSDEAFADAMATIIQNAILSATVTVTGVTLGTGSATGALS